MPIADANIILRYILNDHEILSAKAAEIIENNRINLPIEVACEVVFVLQKVYQVEREKIQEVLSHLIEEDLVCLEKPKLLLKALEVYSETKFDFVDCLLVSYCEVYQESIFTFDKKLENYLKRCN
ncbi:PIN domain-containing protein [Laspinema olomoucense]|uniref:PIN domain-containing protein n=1 Tax=Laspinema olomoucense TaxID=3231600 RepID=UPI0021BACA4A|nr:PIN domain-containing protein [Laspinema sp. D3c]MCT7994115.1 PIN domain-containing protein [Laspinema sp. D3c]